MNIKLFGMLLLACLSVRAVEEMQIDPEVLMDVDSPNQDDEDEMEVDEYGLFIVPMEWQSYDNYSARSHEILQMR